MKMTCSTLREAAQKAGLLVGSACCPHLIEQDPEYAAILAREFNCITAENCMKPMYLQPQHGCFEFNAADRLCLFAERHQQKIRGHTLAWHQQMPHWLRDARFDKKEALDILDDHIANVVGHFQGRVFCWDVVNEALATNGRWRTDCPWFKMTGPDYVAAAFRAANAADSDALLFYNDYEMELPCLKSDGCLLMLKRFLKEGVPIHGVGFQYHLGVENRLDFNTCVANLKRFGDLGLQVHLTEIDMGIPVPVTEESRAAQAEEFTNRIRIARASGVVSAMVFWGFTDRHSWVPSFTHGKYDEALLFDRGYKPKPAWQAVMNELCR